MNGFVLAGVAIAAFAAGAALVSFRYERELRRMARFLDQREPTGNARMTAFVRTRGVLGIARGVNAELDELQNERIASQQARQAFQAGLTCLSHDIRTPLAGAQGYLQLVEDEADPAAKERYLSAAAHRLDDVRVLLDSTSKMMDGKKLTDIKLPFLAGLVEKATMKKISGTVIEELLARYHLI